MSDQEMSEKQASENEVSEKELSEKELSEKELSEEDADETGVSENDFPIPPPTFEFLTLSIKTQTEMSLGLYHFGEEKDRPAPNLRVAQHSIDVLAMLAEKTKGNLSLEEQRLIENSLTELRFRYVQVAKDMTSRQPRQAEK